MVQYRLSPELIQEEFVHSKTIANRSFEFVLAWHIFIVELVGLEIGQKGEIGSRWVQEP